MQNPAPLATAAHKSHLICMQSNFSLFRDRLAEACHLRKMSHEKLCSSVGLGGRRTVDLEISGLKALDIYSLAQIADRLDVSVDWLLGRTDVMEVSPAGETKKAANRSPTA
jgi:hypothetical protein